MKTTASYRIITRLAGIFLIFCLTSCAALQAQEKNTNKEPQTIEDAIKALRPDDPRQIKVELLTWKLRYLKEHLRSIELEYRGLCYKDQRHRTTTTEIEATTDAMRRLLVQPSKEP